MIATRRDPAAAPTRPLSPRLGWIAAQSAALEAPCPPCDKNWRLSPLKANNSRIRIRQPNAAPSLSMSALKPGKLVAMVAASSICIGCSEARPMTRKLMAMR